MPRKAPHLELTDGIGIRQRMWNRIRQTPDGGTFTLVDLLGGRDAHRLSTAREYLAGLKNAGYITCTTPGARLVRHIYTLANDVGVEAPRVRKDGTPITSGLGEEQMWRTLRLLTGDTCALELAAHASTPATPVAVTTATAYLRDLHRAGYLQITRPAKVGGRAGTAQQTRYRLITNTGPRPPIICRTKAVYDPNLGQTVWRRPVTEEDAIHG
jgi:hypothetical protein